MFIREFRIGDAAALRAVFFSSVRELANQDYTAAQLEAWAPEQYDPCEWAERMAGLRPFVAEIDRRAAGYADLQATGYIDHFYVAAPFAGRGVGRTLMDHIHDSAPRRQIAELWADVSLTAESFFAKRGFAVEGRNTVWVRGVALSNARMRKRLVCGR